jgi:hypothetical protein
LRPPRADAEDLLNAVRGGFDRGAAALEHQLLGAAPGAADAEPQHRAESSTRFNAPNSTPIVQVIRKRSRMGARASIFPGAALRVDGARGAGSPCRRA